MGCTESKDNSATASANPPTKAPVTAPDKAAAPATSGLDSTAKTSAADDYTGERKHRKKNRKTGRVEGEQKPVMTQSELKLVAPTKGAEDKSETLTEDFALAYVYGYRGYDCRHNVHFTADGKVAYFSGAVGIVHDRENDTQTFFGGQQRISKPKFHTNDIVSMAISKDRKRIATGQVDDRRPTLFIWEPEKKNQVLCEYQIPTDECFSIDCIAFSADGDWVAFVDGHLQQNLRIGKVEEPFTVAAEIQLGTPEILDLEWTSQKDSLTLAACGAKRLQFLRFDKRNKKIVMEEKFPQEVDSVAFSAAGECFAGTATGELLKFSSEQKLLCKQTGHPKGAINAVFVNAMDKSVYTGGEDGALVQYHTDDLRVLNTVSGLSGPIKAIDIYNGDTVIGTRNGTITLFTSDKSAGARNLQQSHHAGEVWGLTLAGNYVITTGDDNKILQRSFAGKRTCNVCQINLSPGKNGANRPATTSDFPDNQAARAVCYNDKTYEVAVACNDGTVQIRKLDHLEAILRELPASKTWIQAMKYAPDGRYLAIGTRDSGVVIYTAQDYKEFARYPANKEPIVALDWSDDGQFIRTFCEGNDHVFYSMGTRSVDADGHKTTRDLHWASQTVKHCYNTQGVFQPGVPMKNTKCLCANERLVVTGDANNLVKVFRNPCVSTKCISKEYCGHCEPIVRTAITQDSAYIFSVAGDDKSLMQWGKK